MRPQNARLDVRRISEEAAAYVFVRDRGFDHFAACIATLQKKCKTQCTIKVYVARN